MVDGQLHAGGVTEARLLSRFSSLPRERFVPEARQVLAYADDLHWFGRAGASRFMPAPAILGKLLGLAEIRPTDAVLDMGATTGYGTAVMAGLAASVVGLEDDANLRAAAAANLAALDLSNARVIDGAASQFDAASFDVIILQGTIDKVPETLLALLREGGRLVAIVRKGPVGTAHLFTKAGGKVTERPAFNAVLPDLPGQQKIQEFIF